MVSETFDFIIVFPQLQICVKQQLEESTDHSSSSFECLHICENHGVDCVRPGLNQGLATLCDLVINEALFFLV